MRLERPGYETRHEETVSSSEYHAECDLIAELT